MWRRIARGGASPAQLGFQNATAQALGVRFYRGDHVTNEPKKIQTAAQGMRVEYNYSIGGSSAKTTLKALVAAGGADSLFCTVKVENAASIERKVTNKSKTFWVLGNCHRLESATTSPTCNFTCEKSWNDGRSRWRTTFKITD